MSDSSLKTPEDLEKEIYYNFVAVQDKISFDDPKYAEKMEISWNVTAEYYNISVDKLREIVVKGVKENWPEPPMPK